jgi:predicted NBD/HSP70 family sugar kinase
MFYSLSLGFNPEFYAVTGGMLALQDFFLPQAIDIYRQAIRVKYPSFEKPIKISKVGTMAGVIGAARLPRL